MALCDYIVEADTGEAAVTMVELMNLVSKGYAIKLSMGKCVTRHASRDVECTCDALMCRP